MPPDPAGVDVEALRRLLAEARQLRKLSSPSGHNQTYAVAAQTLLLIAVSMIDRLTSALDQVLSSAERASREAALREARDLLDTITTNRRKYGAIATHTQTMSWKISELIGPRQALLTTPETPK